MVMLLRATYIGGPTALFEVAGLRLLTDPTFDPGGTEYRTSIYTLKKTTDPALTADTVGDIDAVSSLTIITSTTSIGTGVHFFRSRAAF